MHSARNLKWRAMIIAPLHLGALFVNAIALSVVVRMAVVHIVVTLRFVRNRSLLSTGRAWQLQWLETWHPLPRGVIEGMKWQTLLLPRMTFYIGVTLLQLFVARNILMTSECPLRVFIWLIGTSVRTVRSNTSYTYDAVAS